MTIDEGKRPRDPVLMAEHYAPKPGKCGPNKKGISN
jgi:hypothetical protein